MPSMRVENKAEEFWETHEKLLEEDQTAGRVKVDISEKKRTLWINSRAGEKTDAEEEWIDNSEVGIVHEDPLHDKEAIWVAK